MAKKRKMLEGQKKLTFSKSQPGTSTTVSDSPQPGTSTTVSDSPQPGTSTTVSDSPQPEVLQADSTVNQADVPNEKDPGNEHSFKFCLDKDQLTVDCRDSMTVLEALNGHEDFEAKAKAKQSMAVVITRNDGAVVSVNFPCCLIDKQEILKVSFIAGPNETAETNKAYKKEDLVTFNVETKGKKYIINILKNKDLASNNSHLCVYGIRGENIETALRRDGRFNDSTFNKNTGLQKVGKGMTMHLLTNKVDELDSEVLKVSLRKMPRNSRTKLPKSSAHIESPCERLKFESISNSEPLQKNLMSEFSELLRQMKTSKGLTSDTEVQNFFRQEYDKSVCCFSEIWRVKELMKRSESVCQIRIEDSPKGTGFLLWDRFVLTNAHVIGKFSNPPKRIYPLMTATFDFEKINESTHEYTLKEELVAYAYIEEQGLDFALLELIPRGSLDGLPPALLSHYSPDPPRDEICIIGHPEKGLVKQIDYSYTVEDQRFAQAVCEHMAENCKNIHIITRNCLQNNYKYFKENIHYDTCFFYGSSGSPVFNKHCCLIGVHTGGYVYQEEAGKTRSIKEYAHPIMPIIMCILKQIEAKNERNNLKEHLQEVVSRSTQT